MDQSIPAEAAPAAETAEAAPGTPAAEAALRRTFAIISHPDAGKTTLTEKLLLFGGAIQLAGQVRAKADRRRTRSDWMRIEQDRGISVATSVMTFVHGGHVFNLLDTPGHEDFSEDTYRTLTAVDAAVMVIDAARGIEAQTRKLFEVCRLRDIPIVTFVNKLDRDGRDPFELLDEIEKTLALDVAPVSWPIGMGREFVGTFDLLAPRLLLLEGERAREVALSDLADPAVDAALPPARAAALREEVELVRAGCQPFDLERFREGHLSPVYFGSALRNFGVLELLEGLGAFAPPPSPRAAEGRLVAPAEERLTGFVFKIQANMDPNHRDRVAFLRVCSGRLRKGMRLHQVRTGKQVPVNAPLFFFAQDRQVAEDAWPGDVVGIANHGVLRIGDTLTEGEALNFRGVPSFAPEILRRVTIADAMGAKKLRRALEQLAEEGVVQLFRPLDGTAWVVGVVGALQLDVLGSRLAAEYGVKAAFETAPWTLLRWVDGAPEAVEALRRALPHDLAEDHDGALVAFFASDWRRRRAAEEHPGVAFHEVREQHGLTAGD